MAKKRKTQSKQELFKEGIYDLANRLRTQATSAQTKHPLAELQDTFQGICMLANALEGAADNGYSLDLIVAHQPRLFDLPDTDDTGYDELPF